MAHISMTGAGSVGETADFLKSFFLQDYALVEEKRRVADGAGTAFLMFESSSLLLSRGMELLALDISGDGKSVTVDAFGHAFGSRWTDEDALPLHTAKALRERGFAELERESWRLSDEAWAAEERPKAQQMPAVGLSELGAMGMGMNGSVEPEKPKKRRGKRSYDPEL